MVKTAFRISLFRTLYLSVRCGGRVIVLRGTRLHRAPGARISLAPGARLILGYGDVTGASCSLIMRPNSCLTVHGDVTIFRGAKVVVGDGAHLEIGHNSYVNSDSTVMCWEHVAIGSDCAISWNVHILDGNSHELISAGVSKPRTCPVSIGNHVWIGTGAIIVGATVGDEAVVAAGSVVTSEVPPKTLAAGNPARVVKHDIAWRL